MLINIYLQGIRVHGGKDYNGGKEIILFNGFIKNCMLGCHIYHKNPFFAWQMSSYDIEKHIFCNDIIILLYSNIRWEFLASIPKLVG